MNKEEDGGSLDARLQSYKQDEVRGRKQHIITPLSHMLV